MAKEAKKKKPGSATAKGFGILNPYGDMWTSEIFETPAEAEAYVRTYWANFPGSHGADPSKYKVVRAKQSAYYAGDLQ